MSKNALTLTYSSLESFSPETPRTKIPFLLLPDKKLLVVVGAGHKEGIEKMLLKVDVV